MLRLSPGNVADISVADELLDAADPVRCFTADKGYDANSLRNRLKATKTKIVIPGRSNQKKPIRHDAKRYKSR